MKKSKLILILFVVFTAIFQSCSSNDDSLNTEKSTALRMFLREMKTANNISGRTSSDNSNMCFEFVYPITLSYNNGTTVSISSQIDLISILETETDELYIEGIAFPFDILLAGNSTPVTITSEEGFWEVIQTCDMDTYDDVVGEGPCYTFVYPFSLMTINNQVIVITSEQILYNLIDDNNQDNYIVDFVYPFSVVSNNQTIQIDNAYEYEQLMNDCVASNCNCPDVYQPVCVDIGGQVIEFPNACTAECAGFSTDDFTDCNSNDGNGFELLGTCFTINYPIQVQYQGGVYPVNTDDELISYINNGNATVVYPIVINHSTSSMTFTIESQTNLRNVIQNLCF